ncbi:hypothetical protein [uncultured Shewanella sp.]|uniref:hypothetical protein n=1 Tax=uncultured Shewanella sp. TaxID=173975 RepID=UPI002618FEBB|nr:hypothetical protein [uncultured Shewanella sp.]
MFDSLIDSQDLKNLDINWDRIITSSLEQSPDHYELILISYLIIEAENNSDTDFTEDFTAVTLEYWQNQIHDDIKDCFNSTLSYDDIDSINNEVEIKVNEYLGEYKVNVSHLEDEIYECVDLESIREGIISSYHEQYQEDEYYSSRNENRSFDGGLDEVDTLFER